VDPSKAAGLSQWPRTLKNIKELRHTLGILGYQRPFIRGYAQIAKPLTDLTKKGIPFCWEDQHTEALDKLIQMVTTAPVLGCPDLEQQYFLEVDASVFALGAVLFQYDDQRRRCDVAYLSKALTPPERNYNIWDREFLAIIAVLHHWRHLLMGTLEPVVILTDHANLQYYRHLQKINRRVAWYINFLEDFNYQLKHILGVKNQADALSRRPDHDDGMGDNEHMVALPNVVFARMISVAAREQAVRAQQRKCKVRLEEWKDCYQLVYNKGGWY
jgi:hypothetical protein